jgi:carbonic anhydrase
LLAGNRNFVGGTLKSVDTDLAEVRNKTALNGQRPWAAVLSCADSRVPVEWAFDVVIGQIFVCRVAGNIATPENIASLEYGVRVLGVLAILVLGHGACGAVGAASDLTGGDTTRDTQISSLYSYMEPGIRGAKDLDGAIRANARFQASVLSNSSRLFADQIAAGKLLIVSGYYDLATGQVTLLRG